MSQMDSAQLRALVSRGNAAAYVVGDHSRLHSALASAIIDGLSDVAGGGGGVTLAAVQQAIGDALAPYTNGQDVRDEITAAVAAATAALDLRYKIGEVPNPSDPGDAANKAWVEAAIAAGGPGGGGGLDPDQVQALIDASLASVLTTIAPLDSIPPASEGGVTALSYFLERQPNGSQAWRPTFVMHQNFYGVFADGTDPNSAVTGTLGDWMVTDSGKFWLFRQAGATQRWVEMGDLNIPQALAEEWPQWGDTAIASPADMTTRLDDDWAEGIYNLVRGDYRAVAVYSRHGNTRTLTVQSEKGFTSIRLGPVGVGAEMVLADGKGRYHRYTAASLNAASWTDAGEADAFAVNAGISSTPLGNTVPVPGATPDAAWNLWLDQGMNQPIRYVIEAPQGVAEVVQWIDGSGPTLHATIRQGSSFSWVKLGGATGVASSWLTLGPDGKGTLRTSPTPLTAWDVTNVDLAASGGGAVDLSAYAKLDDDQQDVLARSVNADRVGADRFAFEDFELAGGLKAGGASSITDARPVVRDPSGTIPDDPLISQSDLTAQLTAQLSQETPWVPVSDLYSPEIVERHVHVRVANGMFQISGHVRIEGPLTNLSNDVALLAIGRSPIPFDPQGPIAVTSIADHNGFHPAPGGYVIASTNDNELHLSVPDASQWTGGIVAIEGQSRATPATRTVSGNEEDNVPDQSDELNSEPEHDINGGLVDINTASRDDLISVVGIGEKFADAVIDGRPWSDLDAITAVKGIGEKSLDAMRDELTCIGDEG